MDADVAIVGAGIAGAMIASRLAAAGVKVVVLEAGPRVQRGDAVVQFMQAAIKVPECAYPERHVCAAPALGQPRQLLRAGRTAEILEHVPAPGGRHHVALARHLPAPRARRLPACDEIRARRRLADRLRVDRAVVCAGGKRDRRLRRFRAGPGIAAQRAVSDARDRADVSRQANGRGASRARRIEVRSTPQGRNSVVRDNRAPCCGNASCIPICPIQAKYDATVHVARAEDGRRTCHGAIGRLVRRGCAGRQHRRVRYKRPDGSGGRITAKIFVIAAHAIETPKLLLMSKQPHAPNGVANASDQVGRNLMDHPVAAVVRAVRIAGVALSRAAVDVRRGEHALG